MKPVEEQLADRQKYWHNRDLIYAHMLYVKDTKISDSGDKLLEDAHNRSQYILNEDHLIVTEVASNWYL